MTASNTPDLAGFKCIGCGTCCRQTGHVRLALREPDIIADFLGMGVREFIKSYTCLTRDRHGLSLIDAPDGACIFLDKNHCRINPVKPAQCRDFPEKWRFSDFWQVCGWAKNHEKP